MEYIGYAALLSTIIITGYCLLKTKADQIDEALKKAEAALMDIQTISIFSTALASVKNDVIPLYNYNIYWDKIGLDPSKASLEDFLKTCKSDQLWGGRSTWIPTVLETVWGQERFSRTERLQFLFDIIKTTKSLRVLRKACQLLD